MNWYYVDAGQRAGPVDDAQLSALASSGKILNDTLVWREGMDNWRMYGEVKAPGSGPIAAPSVAPAMGPDLAPSEAVCAECGRIFNIQDMIPYGGVRVCAGCKPVFTQKLAEGAKVTTVLHGSGAHYGGFWMRVVAKLIDGVILTVPLVLLLVVGIVVLLAPKGRLESRYVVALFPLFELLIQFGFLVIRIGYDIFFVGKYGATPGKMACGLCVVTADGGKVGYARATGRAFAEILSGMICEIGYLIVGFDDQKRALHDHICNTRVVYK
jgi:uncharacterized RDD family membrane protein YckC